MIWRPSSGAWSPRVAQWLLLFSLLVFSVHAQTTYYCDADNPCYNDACCGFSDGQGVRDWHNSSKIQIDLLKTCARFVDMVTSATRTFVSATVMPLQPVERMHLPQGQPVLSMFVARNGAFVAPAPISAAPIRDVRATTAGLPRFRHAPPTMYLSE